MAVFPTSIATDSDLYIAVNATSTQLTDNPLTVGATTVNVVSTTGFPTVGFISIDNEIIKYTGTTATSFTGCTRGADGTTAASHVQNSQVFHNVIAAHHNASKDEIIATQQFISDLIGRTNTQVRLPDGSSSSPSLSFAADLDTGLYRVTSNIIGIATNGTAHWQINGSGEISNASSTVKIYNADGTAALPSFSFGADSDTGIFRVAANIIGFSTAGTQHWQINGSGNLSGSSSGSIIYVGDGTLSVPAYSFNNDIDTGLYRIGTNNLGVSCGGILVTDFKNSGVAILGTTTNDSAATGFIGEFAVSTTGNVASPGTNQWFDITSLSLTAGDWDVTIIAANNSTDYTACTDIQFGIGTTSGNNTPGATQMLDFISMSWAGGHLGKINQTLTKRFSLSSTTTVYAKALMTFTAGTQNGLCQLRARRIR